MPTICARSFDKVVREFDSHPNSGRHYCEPRIDILKNLPPAARRPYYKTVLMRANDSCLVLIFWAPEGKTRPHKHGGSSARIHVLQGTLEQDLFAMWEEGSDGVERRMHAEGEEFCEDPKTVHRIGNASPFDWAVSLHLFEPPLEEMEVFDFAYNQRWTVKGGEDTMGEPPDNVEPIWPTKIPH